VSAAGRPAGQPSARPAGLYLHIPFCSAICPYCDFAVVTGSRARRAAFARRLAAEAALWAGSPLAFDTVYLGGGTPSALSPEELALVLDAARGALAVAPDARLFLEANPEDVTPASLAAWRALGVRTLSLGVQSLDAEALRFLGRRHGPQEARRAVALAREAGFDTVSIDLIYGLPGQGAAAWRAGLAAAVALGPDHLSCYQLTLHEGTPFGRRKERGRLAELPEEAQAELFHLTHAYLGDAGYPAYEVSNFARAPEHRSRHNQKYWDHTPYLGLGPSAHSFSDAGGGSRRWWNERRLGEYEARVAAGERPVAGEEELAPADLALEALMLGLRRVEGIDTAELHARYGFDLAAANRAWIERLVEEGYLRQDGGRLAPTLRGLAVADSLARGFAIA
jgi:putative oxygen-independent coproporphyrinogen III oxidase